MEKNFKKSNSLLKSESFVVKGLILATLILLISVPNAYSLKNSGYGYGYGYGGYGYGFGYSDAVPSAVTGLTCTASGTTVTCSWTAPTTTVSSTTLDNLAGYRYTNSTSSNSTCNTGGSTTTSTTASLTGLTRGSTYYIAVCAYDDVTNYSSAATTSVAISSGGGGGFFGSGSSGTTPATPATPAVPGTSTTPTTPATPATPASASSFGQQIAAIAKEATEVIRAKVESLLALIGEKRSLSREQDGAKYMSSLVRNVAVISQDQRQAIVNFITYGTSTTVKLGAGERAGVVDSFKSAFGKLPTTEKDWNDAIKIANGRWPEQRNDSKESKATDSFEKIYKREPDRNNQHDDAAVVVMTYGLRPSNRNLNSEKVAIKTFRNIYKVNPKTAADWDIVRAIAYSGATR